MTDMFAVRDDGVSFVAGLADAPVPARSHALDRAPRLLAASGASPPGATSATRRPPDFGAAPWFELERAAARFFGIHTYAVHVNGLVRRDDGDRDVDRAAQPDEGHRPGHARQPRRRRHRGRTVRRRRGDPGSAGGSRHPGRARAGAQPAGVVHLCREQRESDLIIAQLDLARIEARTP